MKSIFKILGVSVFVLFISCGKHMKERTKFEGIHTTLLLGVENRQNLVRGWNDITMIVIEKEYRTDIISFPRDTLVYIPSKGWWTLNSMYLVLGIDGFVNWLNHNFEGLHIDNYMVYSIDSMRKLHRKVSKFLLPPSFRRIVNDYEYIEDWARHRHKLKFEIIRQRRLHALIDYCSKRMNYSFFSDSLVTSISELVFSCSEKTSFTNFEGVKQLYLSFSSKELSYYIWDGAYRQVYFHLVKPNGYVFQEGEKHVWVLNHYNVRNLSSYINPYEFSTEDFFKKNKDEDLIVPVVPGLYKSCTCWNGDFLLRADKLISDYDYTNQDFTLQQVYSFYNQFPECRLTREQQELMYSACKANRINFFAAAVQKEKESSLVRNKTFYDYSLREKRAMGYGCWIVKTNSSGDVYRPYEGYNCQIKNGIRVMRKHFDEFKVGTVMKVLSYEKKIKPVNKATGALYNYTPFFGEAVAFGHETIGNRRYMSLWYSLKPYWEKVKSQEFVGSN